jgi:acetate kinase
VVHGGERFSSPVRIDEEVRAVIRELARLAPLHNPANAIGIDAAERALPELPHVAVFDTAFHQSLPRSAYLYAIPFELYETHGLRRYGFHGCSHEFVSLEAARRLGRADLNLVTVHLGNGCSAAAVSGGRSVDTTMGLTPLEGLVMGTRSGDIDPGMLPLLCELTGRDLEGVMRLLNRESGLLGVSGLSNDMRELLEARASGHERAKLAIDVFCHRLARGIMGLTAALPRLDAIIFTGGIGENSPDIRAETLARLRVLGLELDAPANLEHGRHTHGRITTKRAPTALVIPTNEELMIAQHTLETLSRSEV